jgi:hypothetical protein
MPFQLRLIRLVRNARHASIVVDTRTSAITPLRYVAIVTEMMHETRVIPLDRRPHARAGTSAGETVTAMP